MNDKVANRKSILTQQLVWLACNERELVEELFVVEETIKHALFGSLKQFGCRNVDDAAKIAELLSSKPVCEQLIENEIVQDAVVAFVDYLAREQQELFNHQFCKNVDLMAEQDALRTEASRYGDAIEPYDSRELFDGDERLHDACRNGDSIVATQLIEHEHIPVSKRDKDGLPAIHLAVTFGHVSLVRHLLKYVDLTRIDLIRDGHSTLLHAAAFLGEPTMVQLLIDAGCNVEARNESGCTPLMDAADFGRTLSIDPLLNANANIDAIEINGRTALHFAAKAAHHSFVQKLLRYNANTTIQDKQGNTPLHLMIQPPIENV